MKQINIDIESYSSVPLAKCGVYKYAESPDFEILLFGYAVDGGEVQVVDLTAGESKEWLSEQGVETDSLSKQTVAELIESTDGEVEKALVLRQVLAKSSVKKYTAMETVVGSDSRARGLIVVFEKEYRSAWRKENNNILQWSFTI